MFSSKKGKDTKKRGERSDDDVMKMFGLGMPQDDDNDDEESLEAELAALQGRTVQKKKPKKKDEKLMSLDQIEALASASLKDIDDDDDDMDDDDLDDEDLLDELRDIVPTEEDDNETKVELKTESPAKTQTSKESSMIHLLTERRDLYTKAIAEAKAEGSSSKARRYERGLKELGKLLKEAQAGKAVKEDDIPPAVFIKGASDKLKMEQENESKKVEKETPVESKKPTESTVAQDKPSSEGNSEGVQDGIPKPDTSTVSKNEETLEMLTSRRDQYKMVALAKKKEGDLAGARRFFAVFKQFEPVISALEKGQDVDLSKLPPPPDQAAAPGQTQSEASAPPQSSEPEASSAGATVASKSTEPPSAPSSILEALQQRLEKYEGAAAQAKEEGNGSKARRMGRITKQYQEAIRDHKKGKAVNYDELPSPPGFPPIPVPGGSQQQQPDDAVPSPTARIGVSGPVTSHNEKTEVGVNAGSANQVSRNQSELQFILTRQKEFKLAALKAKKEGDIESAKEFLRKAKGMDEMVVAAQSGLRVDITSVPSLTVKEKKPIATAEENTGVQSFVVIDDSATAMSADAVGLYGRLEAALKQQIKTAKQNSDHYKLLGDLSAAKNFDVLCKSSQQDLDTLTMSKLHSHPVPKFHYEMKSFPIVKSHPELSDSEMEVTIVRCINIPLPSGYQPKDMYSYVNYEFPFPNDSPQTGSSNVVKNTINPEFNQKFKVSIDRKGRSLQRILKRQPFLFKLLYQRGFLKSDKTLGQASIKMEHFNNRSMIHDCVDLMDADRGRKAVGGKIEVILKIREPLVDKDVEVVNEKWLVLDSHLRTLQMGTNFASGNERGPKPASSSSQKTDSQYQSVEVSKFEKDLLEKQIASYKSQGRSPPASLTRKLESCQIGLKEAQASLAKGGNTALEYMKQLKKGMDIEKAKAQRCLQSGEKTEAKVCLAKRKILDKEHAQMQEELMLYQFGGFGC